MQRLTAEPEIHYQYVSTEAGDPAWVDDRAAAFVFPRYLDASTRAKELGGYPVFAVQVASAKAPPIEELFADEKLARAARRRPPHHRFQASYHNSLVRK